MIGPIFYILLVFALVAAPAFAGWKLSRKRGQSIRMAITIVAGQFILTPAVALLAFSADPGLYESPAKSTVIYSAMAVAISIMTFVILEMKNTRRDK
ncbi:hypothetical protein [Sphingorhabdus sp. YGSMI21]|uniref:hypothetical protein n=1 Tax=Sphingorhabdus sp. YGSMI21 TaxID=2077182 RepID=UPI000C1F5C47|nr:hypothetical protein [Sphingorhabdus sp. YGSMI21]ATW04787.1 hypothetical protein CHN51_15525 [Sphingorhabdus sp. YGSMI21]